MTNTRVPGARLRRFAERTFDRQTLDRVVQPAIADLQHECVGGAAFVRARAYVGVWKTFCVCLVGDAVRDRQGWTRSIAARTVLYLLLLAGLILLPGIGWWRSFADAHGRSTAAAAAAFFLPATLVMALPMAFFLAIALRRSDDGPRLVGLIPATIAAATACAVVILCGVMFFVPYTNQVYREVVFNALSPSIDNAPRVLSKGLPEMNWVELNEHIRYAPSSRQEALARAHRQLRFAMSASAFVLAMLGLGLTRRWRSRTATAAAALVVLLVYGTFLFLGHEIDGGGYPSAYSVWAANLAFALAGLRLLRSRRDWTDVAA